MDTDCQPFGACFQCLWSRLPSAKHERLIIRVLRLYSPQHKVTRNGTLKSTKKP